MTCAGRRSLLWLGVLGALTLPLGVLAQTPLATEFQVNVFTTSAQNLSVVAASASGDFVIAWDSIAQDGYSFGVFARRFSSAGAPLAGEFQVNTYTNAGQRVPSVAADADGDFVIVWRGGAGGAYEIFGRRFSSAGTALAAEFQVNTYTTDEQINPRVAADDGGDFVVVWHSTGQDGAGDGVFGQLFSSTGAALASEFQVNTHTLDHQRNPSVTAGSSGDFVIAWNSFGQDGDNVGIFARRFSSTGAALASEFQVNAYTSNQQNFATVALDADGDFVVAWESLTQNGYSYGIFGRRFSSAGAFLGSEFQVGALTNRVEQRPSVAAGDDGSFVVVWHTQGIDGTEIFGRGFSSAGTPMTEFHVNTYTSNYQRRPTVATDGQGDFVVTWQSQNQDGDNYGIFARRFAGGIALDIDGNGAVGALTDGLLVLRRFFGFTGTTLTTGAVDLGGCTRCDAAAIQSYIAGLGLAFDIDGNGATAALTDGLLALRYLFGFTGATLTGGAVDVGGCTRCDAASIETYLEGLVT